jgi:hypothetical protein
LDVGTVKQPVSQLLSETSGAACRCGRDRGEFDRGSMTEMNEAAELAAKNQENFEEVGT